MPDLESLQPAGAQALNDDTCRTGDEERRISCSKTQSTRTQEFYLKIHSPTTYFKKNDRAISQLDRSYVEIAHRHPTGAVTKPRKLSLEESTRSFYTTLKIHSTMTYFEANERIIIYLERSHLDLEHESPPGPENQREARSRSSSTRAFSLGSSFHQEMPYLESFGRRKPSHDRVKFEDGTRIPPLANTARFKSSEDLNQLKIDALLSYSTPKKTTCRLQAAKTTHHPFSHMEQEHDHYLPYLDPSAYNLQRSYSQPLCISETLQDNKRLLKTHPFLPKLSRYKGRLYLPYLADCIINLSNSHILLISAICFLF